MKKVMSRFKKAVSKFVVVVTILAAGSSIGVSAQYQIAPADCVDVFSVRCPSTMGDCCVVRSGDFSCVQRIC
jgi:hypothetical protein